MKNQELRSSLVKSGIILALFIFFIYAFAVEGSGGVGGTISSMFTGLLFLIGLSVSLVFCVAVMFGIYFGILYLYDKETCKTIYAELKEQLTDSAKNLSCCPVLTKCSTKQEVAPSASQEDLHLLQDNQTKLESQLTGLQNSLTGLEENNSGVSSSMTSAAEELSQLDEKLNNTAEELGTKATTTSVEETTKKLSADITAVQESVKPLDDKLTKMESALSALETPENETDNTEKALEAMNSAIAGIKEELASMKSSIESLASKPEAEKTESNPAEAEADERHRILPYFTKKNDENKFISLVADAVSKGLTYAQIDDFLKDSLSKEATKVVTGHPSLTKDYIKTIRQLG